MTRWANENKYDTEIQSASDAYGVPVFLIKAIMSLESEFLPGAYRNEPARSSLPPTPDFPAGGDRSIGLMQLLVRTARTLGYTGAVGDRSTLTGLYDPATNIALGVELLRDDVAEAARRGLGLDAAVSAYNGGWRPSLGFGAKLSSGQFANQSYVNVVQARAQYFGGTLTTSPAPDSSSSTAPDYSSSSSTAPPAAGAQDVPSGIVFADQIPALTDAGGTGPVLAIVAGVLAVAWIVSQLTKRRQ